MIDAADQFSRRLSSLREVLLLDTSFDDALGITQSDKRDLVQALRSALCVMPVSFFEDFLRTIIEQFIDDINALLPRIVWSALPLGLRRGHVFDTHMAMTKIPPVGFDDDTHQMATLAGLRPVFDKILSPVSDPTKYILAAESFTSTHSNPSSDTANKMFNKIDIKNVFSNPSLLGALQTYDPTFSDAPKIRLRLDEIVERRHAIAHGRPATSISRSDLEKSVDFLEKLAHELQSVVQSTLSTMSTTLPRYP